MNRSLFFLLLFSALGVCAGCSSEDDGHGHHTGTATVLGTQSEDGIEVEAARLGEVTAGSELDIEVEVHLAQGGVKSVTLWVGSEDARGAKKSKAERENDHFHGHVVVPKSLAPEHKLCVEVDTGSKTARFDFPLQK